MIIDLSFPRCGRGRSHEPTVGQATAERAEQELARRMATGDTEAVAEIYDRYAGPLYRWLCAFLGSSNDAEDALQEVFVRLASGRARPARDLRAYLFVAARNEAYGMLRQRQREQAVNEQTVAAQALTAMPPPHEMDADLVALLQRLPLEQREVIALKVAQDLTFAEIAVLLKISPNTAASRYRYGIERLRLWWQEETAVGPQL